MGHNVHCSCREGAEVGGLGCNVRTCQVHSQLSCCCPDLGVTEALDSRGRKAEGCSCESHGGKEARCAGSLCRLDGHLQPSEKCRTMRAEMMCQKRINLEMPSSLRLVSQGVEAAGCHGAFGNSFAHLVRSKESRAKIEQ